MNSSVDKLEVSVITTIKNEERSIRSFLDSLFSQSRLPQEIIITDGGSTDDTIHIIQAEYIPRYPGLKLIQENCNIAKGRNISIQASKESLIAVTDAGCRLDNQWLEKLITPLLLDSSIDVTGGVTIPDVANSFQKAAGAYLTVPAKQMKENPHLISSRNIAFRKAIWEKAGGYPVWLYLSAEDTLFDEQLRKVNAHIHIVPEAIVYWKPPMNWKKFIKQIYTYSRGNGQAGLYGFTILKTMSIYIGMLIFLIAGCFYPISFTIAFFLLFFYLAYSATRLCIKSGSMMVFPIAFPVKLIMDMSNLFGYAAGLLLRFKHK